MSVGKLTYTLDSTPYISSVDPAIGTHAGGTEVTLTGRHINQASGVTIDGLECTVTLPEESVDCTNADCQIKCTTSAKTTEALAHS